MTSGVRQALPAQIPMPKNGMHGKGVRDTLVDFAEALVGGPEPRSPARSPSRDQHEAHDTPAFPRFAFRLGEMAERTRRLPPDAPMPGADEDAPSAAAASDGTTADPSSTVPFIVVPAAAQKPDMSPRFRASAGEERDAADAVTTQHPSLSREADPIGENRRPALFAPAGRNAGDDPAAVEPSSKPLVDSDASAPRETRIRPLPLEMAREPAAPRITVVAQQAIPAPVASTSATLVGSVAASDLIEPSNARLILDAVNTSTAQAPAHSLRIQLHPAELGMVTATLRFAGEQLSIELRVENREAYHRLMADSDTIVGSLRDIGYDVDRVTILQPPAAARPEPASSLPSRSFDQSGSGAAQSGGSHSGEHASGHGGSARRGSDREGPGHADPASEGGTGLYI